MFESDFGVANTDLDIGEMTLDSVHLSGSDSPCFITTAKINKDYYK